MLPKLSEAWTKSLAADPLSLLICGVEALWIGLVVLAHQRSLIGLKSEELGGQPCLELFLVFIKPLLNNMCSEAGLIILLKEAASIWDCHRHEGGVPGLQ